MQRSFSQNQNNFLSGVENELKLDSIKTKLNCNTLLCLGKLEGSKLLTLDLLLSLLWQRNSHDLL